MIILYYIYLKIFYIHLSLALRRGYVPKKYEVN